LIPPKGLECSLLAAAENAGIHPTEVQDLKDAVEGDASDAKTPPGHPGSRVGKFLSKASLGGLKIIGTEGVKEVAAILGESVRAYYGIS
jgi:hypothetical protein